ncbi:RNA 2',3'-cyclic phosphodiesterase [Paenibacillus frigoriresistens]|uniref:RNA 2',3'-cyclic phosphodiesterase n=1 Tax=Paenibacillus alginolyticus TaxID=59839 RepID=UPI001563855D|nr:RNA 2',3'-cyclic phosphodiesterase [Paenibacillus frigoriresistens]NRF93268.1 RNA 2',3'-cyclic phosphodiesterase [Paenibacillus frigoriresistens]
MNDHTFAFLYYRYDSNILFMHQVKPHLEMLGEVRRREQIWIQKELNLLMTLLDMIGESSTYAVKLANENSLNSANSDNLSSTNALNSTNNSNSTNASSLTNNSSFSNASEKYRLFVGIQLPQDVQRVLDIWKSSLQEVLPFQKWTHPQDVHVTLSFLGDASAETAEALAADLRQLAAAALPLTLHAEGLGVFGPPAAPSILWAGLAGDLDALAALQREVAGVCARHGFPAEARAYRPHLTLARRYRTAAGPFKRSALAAAEAPAGGWPAWRVEDIVLYRSHLGRLPAYEPIGVFPFEA